MPTLSLSQPPGVVGGEQQQFGYLPRTSWVIHTLPAHFSLLVLKENQLRLHPLTSKC